MAILDSIKKKKDAEEPKKEEKKVAESKKEDASTAKETSKKTVTPILLGGHVVTDTALKHPHITEKAAIAAERGVYTFEVHPDANKIQIAQAVKDIYDVEPVRVNIVNLPEKKIMSRGRRGVKAGKKKALVFLKKGDKIEFV